MSAPIPQIKSSMYDVIFRYPIYKSWDMTETNAVLVVRQIRTSELVFDHYCPQCKKEVAWKLVKTRQAAALQKDDTLGGVLGKVTPYPWLFESNFQVLLQCQRIPDHSIHVNFVLTRPAGSVTDGPWRLTKFGQYPSLIDLSAGSKDLEGMLDSDAKKEYRKAGELTAHGYAIAAFLHYRRVLEVLILQAAREAKEDDPVFDEAQFGSLRAIKDRVRYLGDRMPQFLAERSEIHRILSEGLHQWSEERCGEVLPLMKLAVDAVLAQELERKDKKARLLKIQQQLQALDSANSSRDSN